MFTKRKRKCDLQPEFPVFSCKCVWEGRSRHREAHISETCMVLEVVLGKTTLLEANLGVFKYPQVFINILMCQLVKFVVIFCEQAQLVGPGLTAA